ncbi:glutathione S-transferase domain-containing protein [Caballeronia fortuita]|uniref:Glutathione S-transferase domain-containing protein n=1 Tax=Caballeronia fortuita TaxID=1777138 RepID=A0A158CUA3_9BURK|nr:glutathione S-transferase N-terminal domain-containing protein [Caballeronia fortuita]SAK85790.1 glutathione S-transferase domain-containing protein [Caballeronia fortuita]
MILHYTQYSIFARKVMVLAWERDLASRIQLSICNVGTHIPLESCEHLRLSAFNPLMKIPTLITDEGDALFDSRVICEYLDSLHQGPPMFPIVRKNRWSSLRAQALADGAMDAALLVRFENARSEANRWNLCMDLQKRRIFQALDELNRLADELNTDPTIGEISVACLLAYLDFRFNVFDWRLGRTPLSDWFEPFSRRASMLATRPDAEWLDPTRPQ